MPHYQKLKGVLKLHNDSEWGLREALEKLLAKNGLSPYALGNYSVCLSVKMGKRWKLKRRKVKYYNKFLCECCGPYYVVEYC